MADDLVDVDVQTKKRAVEWQLAMVPRRAAAQAW